MESSIAMRSRKISRRSARLAWLRGRPHGEPIRHRGPFVD
jgi:hypothetical protein